MFTTQINIKAWAIYREIVKPLYEKTLSKTKEAIDLAKRNYFSQAVKASYEYFKAIKRGVVKFIKIKDLFTGEAEVQERKILTLEEYGYKTSTDRKTKASQFVFIDMEKALVGNVREFISFNVSQLIW